MHVLSFQEYYTPLVRTQLFEQASAQISISNDDAPISVEVWILVPLRTIWDLKFKKYLEDIRGSFPKLKFRVLRGADRLGNFPASHFMYYYRKTIGLIPVVFHFRGDDLISRFIWLKNFFPKDKYVLDIRGLWPAEFLLNQNKEIFTCEELLADNTGKILVERLKENLKLADGMTTVTYRLGEVLRHLSGFSKSSWVVPCAISGDLVKSGEYSDQGKECGIYVGYLGGVASYQNLPDLVLPFMDMLMKKDERIMLRFVTHQPIQMKKLLDKFNWKANRFEVISVPQAEVNKHLKSMDLGLMIRRKNLVNEVAQPVKIGEYLAAGVPVLVQRNLGGLDTLDFPGIKEIDIETLGVEKASLETLEWINSTTKESRFKSAKESALKLTWEKNIPVHRYHYKALMSL